MAEGDIAQDYGYSAGEQVALIYMESIRSEAKTIRSSFRDFETLILAFGRFACTCKSFYRFLADPDVEEKFTFEYYALFEGLD